MLFYLLIFPISLLAQSVQTTQTSFGQYNPLDHFTFSARGAALGSAYVGIADDSSALLFNPSGLSGLKWGELGIHGDFGWAGNFQQTILLGLPMNESTGVGFAATYFDAGTLEGRDEAGTLISSYGANRFVFQGGGGINLLKDFSVGASLRYSQQIIAGNAISYFSPDFGILFNLFREFKLGVDYLYAGWGTWSGPAVSTLRSGASWTENLDSSTRILVSLGDSLEINNLNFLQSGIEFSYQSRFFIRGGYQTSLQGMSYDGFSFGGGVKLAGFILDYAYLPNGDLGDTHHFSLIYPFQTSAPSPSSDVVLPNKSPGKKSNLNPENNRKDPVKLNENSSVPTQDHSLSKGSINSMEPTGKEKDANHDASSTLSPPNQPMGGALNPDTPKAPENSLTVRFNLAPDFTAQGEAMEAQGNYAESIRLYQEAVKQDPQNALAWRDMGNVYYKLGKKAYALQCFEKVSELRPSDKAFGEWLEKFKVPNP